jgi:hypothetical protein
LIFGKKATILTATIGNQQRQSVKTIAKNLNARETSSLLFVSFGSAGLQIFLSFLIVQNIMEYNTMIEITAVKLIPIKTNAEKIQPVASIIQRN